MSFKPAIASMSLGRCFAHHSLEQKFKAARDAGLSGIEMFYEDLADLASNLPSHPSPSSHIHAAQYIRSLSSYYGLPIIACGPFFCQEGSLSSSARKSKLQELNLWFQVCRILGTDIIQIPSTFTSSSGNAPSISQMVSDLREIADLGAAQKPPFRFAFENLCFGAHIDTWSGAWEIVKGVDRDNFGLCLDTFNIAGREFADPASPSGTVPMLKRHSRRIVDAERLAEPLVEGHEFYTEGMKARMSWSRNSICDGLGYNGWVSFELFNRSLVEKGDHVPREHAERAVRSWEYVCEEMGWENVCANVNERRAERERRGEIGTDVMARL
ncbi:4-hydroxyphenylpyruvate [Botrytis cinerea]